MADAAARDAHQHFAALAAAGRRPRSRTAARRRRSAIGGAFVMTRTSTRGAFACPAKILASATKPSTGISSARAVGSMPAAASSASGIDAERFEALPQHLAALAEGRLGHPLQAPARCRRAARRAARGARPRRSLSAAARRPTAPRRTGSSPRVRQPPAPKAGHRFCCRARRRCARRPRAGTSAPARRTRAATARRSASRPAARSRYCRAGWRRSRARVAAEMRRVDRNRSASPATISSRPG